MLVYNNTSLNAKLQSCFLCQCSVRRNTYSKHCNICIKGFTAAHKDLHTVFFFLKTFYIISQSKLDTMFPHLTMYNSRHICIKRIHKLLRPLNYGDIHTYITQILCKFQAYETTTCQHNRLNLMFVYVFLNPQCIFYSTQSKELVYSQSRKFWLCRLCTRRKEKLVIAFLKHLSCI